MRFFAIGIEDADGVTVKRLQGADPRKLHRAAMFGRVGQKLGRREDCRRPAVRLFASPLFCGLAQTNACASPVLIDEFDAGAPQDALDYCKSFGIAHISTDLDVGDGVAVEPGCCRQITNSPVEGSSRHSYLCTCHRFPIVLLSHVQ
jgi:hypothetical protein